MKRLAVLLTLLFGTVALAQPSAEEVKKALKEIEGTYKASALKKGGEDAPAQLFDTFKGLTIKGDKISIDVGGGEKNATIKLDPSKSPKHMDLVPDDGPEKGKSMKGIYSLEKGELKICFVDDASSDRPKSFDQKEGKVILIIVKK